LKVRVCVINTMLVNIVTYTAQYCSVVRPMQKSIENGKFDPPVKF